MASQAVLQGLSPDGGLFVPDHLPQLNLELMDLPKLTYQELAFKIFAIAALPVSPEVAVKITVFRAV